MDEQDVNEEKKTNDEIKKTPFPKVLVLHSKEIVMAVVVGVIITVFSSIILNFIYPETELEPEAVNYYPPSQPQVEMVNQSIHRSYFIKASMANVMANLTPIKMQISMYYQMNGKFPKEGKEINLSSFDLNEHEQITSTYLTEAGGIAANLTSEFGDNKFLVLQPHTSKNGAFIKWGCFTNIDEKYLGISRAGSCEFKSRL